MTIIELLVAILTSIVVVGALMAILEVTLRQDTRITDRAQADQLGRAGMNKVIEELHSSCTGFGDTAIQAPSTTPTKPLESSGRLSLRFLSAYGNETSGNAEIKNVIEHEILWTKTKESDTGLKLGTLTDYAFKGSGSAPSWTFPALSETNATKTVIAKNVVPIQLSGEPTIFQYFKYENKTSSSSAGQLVALGSSELPLTSASAENVAKVTVSFTQAPESEDTRLDRAVSFSDSVVLHFDPSEATSEDNLPCE